MQNTSALWKALAATGTARLETVAVIGGQEYTAISSPVIRRGLTQDGLSVGNAVAASCSFSLRTSDAIPRAAEVVVRMRLSNGEQTSEWLPAGTFYVSHRSQDAVTGLVSLECYDAMLKANAMFPTNGAWPRTMAQVATDIAAALGVQMDARTTLQTGNDFRILVPRAGSTIRDVLCDIASAHGGNWVLTKENKLRLVPLETPNAANAAQVPAVLGGVNAGTTQTVTGLRATGTDEETLIGTEAGLVIEIASPYVTSGTLSWLSSRLIGVRYQPFTLSNAIYDPALELGDALRSKEDVTSALYAEAATLGLAFRGDISAPEPEELADEYPYVGTADRLAWLRGQVDRLDEEKADTDYVDAAETRANQVTAALNAALNQQGIFDRLTNNGTAQGIYLDNNGNLYVNGTYIASGTLNANLIRAGTISDASGDNYWILDGNNSEFVTQKATIGNFRLEDGDLQYGSQEVGGTGAYIGKDGISYNVTFSDGNLAKTELFAQGIKMYWENTLRTTIMNKDGGLHIRTVDINGNINWPLQIWNSDERLIYLRFYTHILDQLVVDGNTTLKSKVWVRDKLTVNNDLAVDGNTTLSGGLTLGAALSIANGGTGATNAAGALANLGAMPANTTFVSGVKGSNESSYRSGNVNLTAANVGAMPANTTYVSGVKGNSESSYRSGNVNITPANIGALPSSDVANNLTTTTTGKALDAYQGKVLADKFSALEEKQIKYYSWPYFTEREAFKARRVGNSIVIFSYVNITTQVPAGTRFADIGFSNSGGNYLFTSADGTKSCHVTCSLGKLYPTDSTLTTGYYYVVGCALIPV